MLKTARLRREFLPHKYAASGLRLQIEKVRFDSGDVFDKTDPHRHLVAIEDYKDWDTATLYGTVRVQEDIFDSILPEQERDTPPLEICVALRCNETYLRKTFKDFQVDWRSERKCTLEIPLERAALSNTAELTASLIRTTNCQDGFNDGYAVFKGAAVAGCRGWEIRIDPPKLPSSNYLDIRYTHFDAEKKARLYEIACDTASPIIWLNKDNPEIANVLNSKAKRGITARMRDVFFDMITYAVWNQLFFKAASDIDEDGVLVHEWEYAVLEDFLPDLFPDMNSETARMEFAQVVHSDGLYFFLQQIDTILQERIEFKNQMAKLIQEGLNK